MHQQEPSLVLGRGSKTEQTEENNNQKEHHNVEDFLPTEATQIDMEEEQVYSNQRRRAAYPSTDSRKQRIQWPPADNKRWRITDKDLDNFSKGTRTAGVSRNLLHYQQMHIELAPNVLE